MKKNIVFIFISLFISYSCNNETDDIYDNDTYNDQIIVLKERTSPWESSSFDSKQKNALKYASISHRDLLGYSLKNKEYPLEDTKNIGNQVIDIAKLAKDYPNYVRSWKNNTGEATYFTYANFNRYVSNSTITKVVNNGFSLNLGLFSIGNKSNSTSIFSKNLTEDKNAVFGELDVIIRDSIHQIQYSSNIHNIIKKKYISQDFKDELYNTHPSEFFNNYGGFVITSFVTGGKAIAKYTGLYKKTEYSETKEQNMDSEINSSFKFDYKGKENNGGGEGNLKLGRGNTSTVSITNEFSTLMMSIKTIGGNSSFAAFSVPKEIKNTEINLSSWLSSLDNKDNLNIVEYKDNSLVPVSDFIIEKNLQSFFKSYYSNGVNNNGKLTEPVITISLIAYSVPQIYVIGTKLKTRFGDEILLKSKFMGNMAQPNFDKLVNDYVTNEANRIYKMFNVKVVRYVGTRSMIGEIPKTYFDFDGFQEGDLRKYVYNGVTYIVTNYIIKNMPSNPYNNKKLALSIYSNKILKEYGMTELINRLPSINIDYDTFIDEYEINAL